MHRASALWQRYLNALQKSPWRTWSLQTGAIMGTGDIISQMLVDKKEVTELDPVRTARFAGMGLFFVGPTVRTWYLTLEKMFGVNGAGTAIKKMLSDQLLFAPAFLGSFMVVMGLIQQQPFNKVWDKINEEYFDVLQANYMIWPAVQTINFYLVPLQHRILLVNGNLLITYSYLMWLCNKPCLQCPIKTHGTSSIYILEDDETFQFQTRRRIGHRVCGGPTSQVVCRDVPFPNRKSICYEPDMPEEKPEPIQSTGEKIKHLIPKLGNVANNVLFRKHKNEQPEYDECCRVVKHKGSYDSDDNSSTESDDTKKPLVGGEKKEKSICQIVQRDDCMKSRSQEKKVPPCPKDQKSSPCQRNDVKKPPKAKCTGKSTCPRDNTPIEVPICTCDKKPKIQKLEETTQRQPALICLEDKRMSVKRCLEEECSCAADANPMALHIADPSKVTLNDSDSWPLVSKLWLIMKQPFRPAECIKKSKSVPECKPSNDKLQTFKDNHPKRCCMRKQSTTTPVSICPQPRSQVCTCKSRPRPKKAICTCKPKRNCSCPRKSECPPPPKPKPPCIRKSTCPAPICTQRQSCPHEFTCPPVLVVPAPCIHKHTCPKPPCPPEPPRCPPLKQECIKKKTCPKARCIKKSTCPPPRLFPVDCKDFCFRVKEKFESNVLPPPEDVEEFISPTSIELPPISIEIADPNCEIPPFQFEVPPTRIEFTNPCQEFQVYSLLLPQPGISAPSVSQSQNPVDLSASPSTPIATSAGGGGEMASQSSVNCAESAELTTPHPMPTSVDQPPETPGCVQPPPPPPTPLPAPSAKREECKEEAKDQAPPPTDELCDAFFVQEPIPEPSIYYESQTPGTSEGLVDSNIDDSSLLITEPSFSSEGEFFPQSPDAQISLQELPLSEQILPELQEESDASLMTQDIYLPLDTLPDLPDYELICTDAQGSMPSIHSEVPDSLPPANGRSAPLNFVPQRPPPGPPMYSEAPLSLGQDKQQDFIESDNVELVEPPPPPEIQPQPQMIPTLYVQQQIPQLPVQQFGPVPISTTPGTQICTFPVPSTSQTQIHLTVSLSAPQFSLPPQPQLPVLPPPPPVAPSASPFDPTETRARQPKPKVPDYKTTCEPNE